MGRSWSYMNTVTSPAARISGEYNHLQRLLVLLGECHCSSAALPSPGTTMKLHLRQSHWLRGQGQAIELHCARCRRSLIEWSKVSGAYSGLTGVGTDVRVLRRTHFSRAHSPNCGGHIVVVDRRKETERRLQTKLLEDDRGDSGTSRYKMFSGEVPILWDGRPL